MIPPPHGKGIFFSGNFLRPCKSNGASLRDEDIAKIYYFISHLRSTVLNGDRTVTVIV